MGRLGSRRSAVAGIAALAVLAVMVGAQVASAQQEAQQSAADSELLERLAELESQLPAAPPPASIVSPEGEKWGAVEGDFTAARAQLTTLEPDLRRLFVDADAANGEVADAVANVARGWLLLWEAYEPLSAWESNDLAFPLDTRDDDQVATGADTPRGLADKGLTLVLQGRTRHLAGYVALRDLGTAEADLQAQLDDRAHEAEAFYGKDRVLLHKLLAQESSAQLLVPVERFTSSAPGIEARARSYTVTCMERSDYLAANGADGATEVADANSEAPTTPDCPDLPEGAAEVSSP